MEGTAKRANKQSTKTHGKAVAEGSKEERAVARAGQVAPGRNWVCSQPHVKTKAQETSAQGHIEHMPHKKDQKGAPDNETECWRARPKEHKDQGPPKKEKEGTPENQTKV